MIKFISKITLKGNSSYSYKYLERAEKQAKYLDDNNCVDCINCVGCENSNNCVGCVNCLGCVGCVDCVACTDCVGCRGCEGKFDIKLEAHK